MPKDSFPKLLTKLVLCGSVGLILGGWWAEDRGLGVVYGAAGGLVLGLLVGLALGGYLQGRWLDVLYPPRRD